MSEGNDSKDPASTEQAKKAIEKMKEQAKRVIAEALKKKKKEEKRWHAS